MFVKMLSRPMVQVGNALKIDFNDSHLLGVADYHKLLEQSST